MKARTLAVLVLVLLWTEQGAAFNEPDGFQKLKFGQDPKLLAPECPKPRIVNWEICWEGDKYNPGFLRIYNTKVGKAGLINGLAWLIDGRMESLTFDFASIFFTELLATFTEGYGEPTKMETEIVRNRAGASFKNRIAIWTGEKISIRLEERSYRVDDGKVTYETPKWKTHREQKFKEDVTKGVKDL
jgi:hypothetical protein